MRFFFLLYTFICWYYPLLYGYSIVASGQNFSAVDPTLLIMTFSAILLIPVNYYFLNRISASSFSKKVYNTHFILLLITLLPLGYFSFTALSVNLKHWRSYMPLIGFILTVVILIMLQKEKVEAEE